MIRINLLPETERRSKLPLARIFTLVSVLVIGLCFAGYSYNLFTIWRLESQINDTKNRHAALVPVQVKMAESGAEEQLITTKSNLLVTVKKQGKPWHDIIAHLNHIAPPEVWFSRFALDDKDKEKRIKIGGIAKSYPDIANFMQQLEQDNVFANPALLTAEATDKTVMPANVFVITAQLKELKK